MRAQHRRERLEAESAIRVSTVYLRGPRDSALIVWKCNRTDRAAFTDDEELTVLITDPAGSCLSIAAPSAWVTGRCASDSQGLSYQLQREGSDCAARLIGHSGSVNTASSRCGSRNTGSIHPRSRWVACISFQLTIRRCAGRADKLTEASESQTPDGWSLCPSH